MKIYLKKHRERFVYVQIGTKTNSFSMFFYKHVLSKTEKESGLFYLFSLLFRDFRSYKDFIFINRYLFCQFLQNLY